MTKEITLEKLNSLLNVPMESWKIRGVILLAVSANSNGHVNSGLIKTGQYFYRKYDYDEVAKTHSNPRFVFGKEK